jgi:hypothetical protein
MDPSRWVRKHSDSNGNGGGCGVSLQSLSIISLLRQMGNMSTRKAKDRGVQGKGKTTGLKRREDGAIQDSNHPH